MFRLEKLNSDEDFFYENQTLFHEKRGLGLAI